MWASAVGKLFLLGIVELVLWGCGGVPGKNPPEFSQPPRKTPFSLPPGLQASKSSGMSNPSTGSGKATASSGKLQQPLEKPEGLPTKSNQTSPVGWTDKGKLLPSDASSPFAQNSLPPLASSKFCPVGMNKWASADQAKQTPGLQASKGVVPTQEKPASKLPHSEPAETPQPIYGLPLEYHFELPEVPERIRGPTPMPVVSKPASGTQASHRE